MVAILVVAHLDFQVQVAHAGNLDIEFLLFHRIKLLGTGKFATVAQHNKVGSVTAGAFIVQADNGMEHIEPARKRVFKAGVSVAADAVAERLTVEGQLVVFHGFVHLRVTPILREAFNLESGKEHRAVRFHKEIPIDHGGVAIGHRAGKHGAVHAHENFCGIQPERICIDGHKGVTLFFAIEHILAGNSLGEALVEHCAY